MILSRYRKAIAALVTPIVAWFALKAGFDIDTETQAAIVGIITSIVVGWIPNEP